MPKLVSTIAGLILLVSTIIADLPRSIAAANTENMPVASWPHTIVLYQPQAIVRKEYRTLEMRMAVGVTKKGAQKPVVGTLEGSVDGGVGRHPDRFRHALGGRFQPDAPLLTLSLAGHGAGSGNGAGYSAALRELTAQACVARCYSPEPERERKRQA